MIIMSIVVEHIIIFAVAIAFFGYLVAKLYFEDD
jgi:hypothetical protein